MYMVTVGGWIRAEGGCEGRCNHLKYFIKGGGTEERGRGGRKILKGRQAGARGGCLKKEGAGTPLLTNGKVVKLFFESSPTYHKINWRFFMYSNDFLKLNGKISQLYIMLMIW